MVNSQVDFRSISNSTRILKYADDTIIVGLISKDKQDSYKLEMSVNWYNENELVLNRKKAN